MNKYDALYKNHKEILNENARLKKENEALTVQRKALSHELLKVADYEKSIRSVFDSFSTNLVKSFKSKNVINMNEDERNAMYYMIEHYIDFVDLLKSYELETIDTIC